LHIIPVFQYTFIIYLPRDIKPICQKGFVPNTSKLIAKQTERIFKQHLGIYTSHLPSATTPAESNLHSATAMNEHSRHARANASMGKTEHPW